MWELPPRISISESSVPSWGTGYFDPRIDALYNSKASEISLNFEPRPRPGPPVLPLPAINFI